LGNFAARSPQPPLIPLIILKKNSQRFGLTRGNAGFSTAAVKK